MMKYLSSKMLRAILSKNGELHLEKRQVPTVISMPSLNTKFSFRRMKSAMMINGGLISFSGITAAFVIILRTTGIRIYNSPEVIILTKTFKPCQLQSTFLLL